MSEEDPETRRGDHHMMGMNNPISSFYDKLRYLARITGSVISMAALLS